MEKIEQRAVIKHCVRAGMTPVNTLKFMNAGKTCKLGLVYKWHARFANGREVAYDDRDRRPKTTERVRSRIKEALKEDYWWTCWSFWCKLWNCLLYYNKRIKDDAGIPDLWVKTSQCAFKSRNIFSNATHRKASVSCRASLRVMNQGSISMIRRQKQSHGVKTYIITFTKEV